MILEIKVCTNPYISFNNGLDNTGQGAVREPPPSVIASKIDPLLLVLNLGTLKKLIFSCFAVALMLASLRPLLIISGNLKYHLRGSKLVTKVREKKYLLGVKVCVQLAP